MTQAFEKPIRVTYRPYPVRLPAGDPLPALEAPVVGVRQHDLHEHVVVPCQVQTRHVEAQEREHPSAETRRNKQSMWEIKSVIYVILLLLSSIRVGK